MSAASNRGFPLVEAVEALTEAGYVVLTADQAEEITAFLGRVAFENFQENVAAFALDAQRIAENWPESGDTPAARTQRDSDPSDTHVGVPRGS